MTSGTEHTLELDAVVLGAGVAGLYQLHQLRAAGPAGARLRRGRRRGRHVVLEPLPGRPLRQRGLHLPVPVRRGPLQGLELEREVPRPARDRALDALRDRPASTCAATSSSPPRSPARTTTRTAAAGRSGPTAATSSTPSSSSAARGCCPRRWRTSSRARTASAGEILHTSRWPDEGVELAGKRVGVVGIGATGIQVIQTIADEVAHLTVFARTPQYVLPMKNPSYGPEEQAAYKARFEELQSTHPAHLHRLRVRLRARLGGVLARAAPRRPRGDLRGRLAQAVARELRRDVLRRRTSARRSRSSSGRRCGPGSRTSA